MTKTDWTAEEVRKAISGFAGYCATHHGIGSDLMDIAAAFAMRIEADEGAVATGYIVVKEHTWQHDDGGRPTLAYLWPSEFGRTVFPTFEQASAFIRKEPGLPLGWVAMQIGFTHPPAQPAQVQNPDDLNGDPSGEWYCEEHPQFLQSHDNCGGAGIPSCARIPCLMHQIRQLEQRNRELVHQYGFLAEQATAEPAQPAQVDKCCCGEPSVSGVRHRLDGPCYLSDAEGTQAQEQPGWKWVPVVPTETMMDAAMQREDDEPLTDWVNIIAAPHDAIYKAMLAAAPTPPKEK